MNNNASKGIKQLYPGKFLFHMNENELYYLTFESLDMINIEIILIKLRQKETYVYKTVIPFQKIGTNDTSAFDTLKNLNFIIYNFDFSLKDKFNKVILVLNSKFGTQIELFLYNKNMEKNNETMKQKLQRKKDLENMQSRMNELYNIIQFQNKKIFEIKKREEAQIKLINKVEEVTKNISEQYNKEFRNNNNNDNNFNNYKNNIHSNGNNEMKKDLLRSARPNNYTNPNNLNFGMNPNKNKKLNITVNVALRPILPDNTNVDNLLTRPQNMYPIPQPQPFEKTKSINLDNIEDYYRH